MTKEEEIIRASIFVQCSRESALCIIETLQNIERYRHKLHCGEVRSVYHLTVEELIDYLIGLLPVL